MKVAICDDEVMDLTALRDAVENYDATNRLQVYAYSCGKELYQDAQESNFDLAILDIEMEDPNGYEIAHYLRRLPQPPLVIFLTKSMAYTLRGYGVAFRYLRKPIDFTEFTNAMDAAIREITANRFAFAADGASHVLHMEQIYYFEVFNHYTILHTMDAQYEFRGSLKDVWNDLPPGYFGIPHQSYIVNFAHVRTATASEIRMTNGAVIPVSRRKQKEFAKQLYQYLGR